MRLFAVLPLAPARAPESHLPANANSAVAAAVTGVGISLPTKAAAVASDDESEAQPAVRSRPPVIDCKQWFTGQCKAPEEPTGHHPRQGRKQRFVLGVDQEPRSLIRGNFESDQLTSLHAFRFSPLFRGAIRSLTYSHKIYPQGLLCRFDLQGVCNDDNCTWQHMKDVRMSEEELLADTASFAPDSVQASTVG
jgi:hypothetical protein